MWGASDMWHKALMPSRPALPSAQAVPVKRAPHSAFGGELEVRQGLLFRRGAPFRMSGVNFWSAVPLCSADGAAGSAGFATLCAELDALQRLGVNTVRIMGASEGPDSEPWRIVPSLQPAEGVFAAPVVRALVRVAEELARREMVAIVCLNNFWHWSGGMAQYVSWATGTAIPYPNETRGWLEFQQYAAQFYSDPRALAAFSELVRFLVPQLREHGAVVWELANEPRGINNEAAYVAWIHATARLLKQLSPAQLVATGSEGETTKPAEAGLDVIRDHGSEFIDLVTCHVWAQNWGWLNPATMGEDLPRSLQLAKDYIKRHAVLAEQLGKPLILEEFGFPRDGGSFDPGSRVTYRDRYFRAVYEHALSLTEGGGIAGVLPWAWAGSVFPNRPGTDWKPGDTFTGDPPHELSGWYSIYQRDPTTALIAEMSAVLRASLAV